MSHDPFVVFPDDPIALFQRWFVDAQASVPMPEAMTLATADANGQPSARLLLLKGVDGAGFSFFTNFESGKAADLNANPFAALVFWWEPLRRQVRVEGSVKRVSAAESDAYFQTRARASQLGAWASPQSRTIPDRAFLERRFEELQQRFEGQPVGRPPHWGGFLLAPERIEFWREQPHRLHDRLLYTRSGDGWQARRLAP